MVLVERAERWNGCVIQMEAPKRQSLEEKLALKISMEVIICVDDKVLDESV